MLLKAAAMDLAPVTTDVAGGGQFVTDGENGLKVPVGDPDRLAGRCSGWLDGSRTGAGWASALAARGTSSHGTGRRPPF